MGVVASKTEYTCRTPACIRCASAIWTSRIGESPGRPSAQLRENARHALDALVSGLTCVGGELRMLYRAGEQFEERLVQRLAARSELLGDRLAVLSALDHSLDAAKLTFDAP